MGGWRFHSVRTNSSVGAPAALTSSEVLGQTYADAPAHTKANIRSAEKARLGVFLLALELFIAFYWANDIVQSALAALEAVCVYLSMSVCACTLKKHLLNIFHPQNSFPGDQRRTHRCCWLELILCCVSCASLINLSLVCSQ